MQVFISYAEEDSANARKLAEDIRHKCSSIDVIFFQDEEHRGGIIFEKLTKDIAKANIFLTLLSNSYLQSEWCRVEFEAAFHLERDARTKKRQFEIQILNIGKVERDALVFERIYDWIDANDEKQYQKLLDKLSKTAREEKEAMPTEATTQKGDWVPFINREEELRYLVRNLENTSGYHFHVIVAPPKMGKTWLLVEFSKNLLKENNRWVIQTVDLKDDQSARSNLFLLLRKFNFDLPKKLFATNQMTDENITEATNLASLQVSKSKRPWLLILDSAELLEAKTARQLRGVMANIRKDLRVSPGTRLSFIASSRTEINEFITYAPLISFVQLPLTGFTENVIEDLVNKIADSEHANISGNEYATILLKETNGLPALISIYLTWMKEKGFLPSYMTSLPERKLFDKIAGDYIKNDLLATDVLIPRWPNPKTQEEARIYWENLTLKSSVFRLVARPHIRTLSQDKAIKSVDLQIGQYDLMDEFGKLPIVIPIETIWYRMHPSIRQLLFKYKYSTKQEQAEEHKNSEALYAAWINDLAGTDRIAFLIEQIWHHVEYVRLLGKENGLANPDHHIEDFIKKLCKKEKQHINGLSYGDFVNGISRSIESDKELPASLECIQENLVERILSYLKTIK